MIQWFSNLTNKSRNVCRDLWFRTSICISLPSFRPSPKALTTLQPCLSDYANWTTNTTYSGGPVSRAETAHTREYSLQWKLPLWSRRLVRIWWSAVGRGCRAREARQGVTTKYAKAQSQKCNASRPRSQRTKRSFENLERISQTTFGRYQVSFGRCEGYKELLRLAHRNSRIERWHNSYINLLWSCKAEKINGENVSSSCKLNEGKGCQWERQWPLSLINGFARKYTELYLLGMGVIVSSEPLYHPTRFVMWTK